MNSLSKKNYFDENGYVVIPQFLEQPELNNLQQHLDRYIQEVVPHLSESDAFYHDPSRPESLKQLHRMSQDSFFEQYAHSPHWSDLAEVLIGEKVTVGDPEWFNKPSATNHVTPPHQDNFYFSLTPPKVVTLWLALDEIDTENGCLRYVKRSHLDGFRDHARSNILGFSQGIKDYSPTDFTNEIAVCLQPGDLVAHHGMTIHRADANISKDRQRRSFAMVFKGVSCQRDEEAHQRYMMSASEQFDELGLK